MGNRGRSGILLAFLLAAGTMWAQIDDRPLRAVPPDTPIPHYPLPIASYPRPSPNSLLTAHALEQPLTQRYITQYTSPSGIAYLNAALERGSIYLPFIKEEIKKRNMPPELAYLPVIESSFVITARSRSGAVGLWQFMLNSISPFNIKANDFIDERMDFMKSTRGALQKLEDNYRTLGNWELALAAYNAGLGGVSRIIQRTRTRDYWELSEMNELRQETVHYVPKFYAAAWVLSQPRRFGIDYWQQSQEWAAISLPRQVSLDVIAEETGIDRVLLRRLNAELLHGISPADSSYLLKIPAARLEQINAVMEQEDLNLIRYHYHVVRHGDTLWSMSRHYGTSLDIIEQHNQGISSRYLRIGETIIIPAFNDIQPPPRQTTTHRFDGQYVVRQGDTLWSVSRRYGVDPQDLAEANDMTLNQILREGRTLRVPILE